MSKSWPALAVAILVLAAVLLGGEQPGDSSAPKMHVPKPAPASGGTRAHGFRFYADLTNE